MTGRPSAEVIKAWRQQDPDPATVARLDDLVGHAEQGDAAAAAELAEAFAGRLEFGTAGLRGRLGPGPNRMNRVVVGQAAAGLARYLHDQELAGEQVLIGYDARHNSEIFAVDTAEILAGAGFRPLLTDGPVPTPLVAFGIRHFGCAAAVVVTASHNPPADNGYKVYLGDGIQIVPPADEQIAAEIDSVARDRLDRIPRSTGYRRVGSSLRQAYLDRAASLPTDDGPRDLCWVHTALHGVGGSVVAELVDRAGFTAPYVVTEQAEPDADFPTVAFPNPEEPGALDLAIALARDHDADLVVANDPDADRCAVAVPQPSGGWRMLTGDELGALLADDALRRDVAGTYACSIVSSSLLQVMADDHGRPFRSTLTGFKWIARVPDLAFGYEEAIGYCCDQKGVADKDGITALLRVLAMAAELKADGRTLLDRLDDLAARYGVYATDQLSIRVEDMAIIGAAMDRLRTDPPTVLADEPVQHTDLAAGVDLGPAGVLPPTDAVLFAGDRVRVVVRPSGTEPKLKCYLEARVPVPGGAIEASRRQGRDLLGRLRAEMSTALRMN